MTAELTELQLNPVRGPLPRQTVEFVREGLRRARSIDCFDFVPSDYWVVHGVLAALPRGRFSEWGSGIGIATGLAGLLGFEAHGIEIHPELADASRLLLADFGIAATIDTGSYFEIGEIADVYFTYCWPGQMRQTEERFVETAPVAARLLICHGAEDIRCKVKSGFPDFWDRP